MLFIFSSLRSIYHLYVNQNFTAPLLLPPIVITRTRSMARDSMKILSTRSAIKKGPTRLKSLRAQRPSVPFHRVQVKSETAKINILRLFF
jgi:hypothetical protein